MITLQVEDGKDLNIIHFDNSFLTLEELLEKLTLFIKMAGFSVKEDESLILINQDQEAVIPKAELATLQHEEYR
jgi:hypothetical protein